MTFINTSARTCRHQVSIAARLSRAFAVWRQRKVLNRLDSAALRDIGITRAQAEAEARRPVWDVPDSWRS